MEIFQAAEEQLETLSASAHPRKRARLEARTTTNEQQD
jgi:hypothetical protein